MSCEPEQSQWLPTPAGQLTGEWAEVANLIQEQTPTPENDTRPTVTDFETKYKWEDWLKPNIWNYLTNRVRIPPCDYCQGIGKHHSYCNYLTDEDFVLERGKYRQNNIYHVPLDYLKRYIRYVYHKLPLRMRSEICRRIRTETPYPFILELEKKGQGLPEVYFI